MGAEVKLTPREFADPVSTGAILAPLATATGGGVKRLEAGGVIRHTVIVDPRADAVALGEDIGAAVGVCAVVDASWA